VTEHLDPANQVGPALVAPAPEQGLRLPRALGAACEAVAPFGERFEHGTQRLERGADRSERIGELALPGDRGRGDARALLGQREAKVLGRLVQRGGEMLRVGRIPGARERLDANVRASSTSCAVERVSPKKSVAVSGSWCASSKITVLQEGSSSAIPSSLSITSAKKR